MSNASKPSRVLKIALAALCLVAFSVGATLFFTQSQIFSGAVHDMSAAVQTSAAPPLPADVPAPIFLEMEPFTVTLRNALGHRRVLYVVLTLNLVDDTSRMQFGEYMPEVRDRVLGKLAEQDPAEVQTPEGRLRLAQELQGILQAPYHPQLPAPHINKVLFTAFVVQ